MMILQLTRRMVEPPVPIVPTGVKLRHYASADDIGVWLELRRKAFARQKLGVRDWDEADFAREFLGKAWWRPETMWFAESEDSPQRMAAMGTVTLARRGVGAESKPVVHWLAVLPGFRGRGVGRLLMAALEAAVWESGERQIWLETHSQWIEASRFYRSLGYEPVGP